MPCSTQPTITPYKLSGIQAACKTDKHERIQCNYSSHRTYHHRYHHHRERRRRVTRGVRGQTALDSGGDHHCSAWRHGRLVRPTALSPLATGECYCRSTLAGPESLQTARLAAVDIAGCCCQLAQRDTPPPKQSLQQLR